MPPPPSRPLLSSPPPPPTLPRSGRQSQRPSVHVSCLGTTGTHHRWSLSNLGACAILPHVTTPPLAASSPSAASYLVIKLPPFCFRSPSFFWHTIKLRPSRFRQRWLRRESRKRVPRGLGRRCRQLVQSGSLCLSTLRVRWSSENWTKLLVSREEQDCPDVVLVHTACTMKLRDLNKVDGV